MATDLPDRATTLQAYGRRRWVDGRSGDLKGKGLDLDRTHLHTPDR